MIQALVFDLDGTIIDSIYDLTDSLNYALKKVNLEPYEPNQVKKFVGEGMFSLIEKAVLSNSEDKNSKDKEKIQQCYQIFFEHYKDNAINKTVLFDGVEEFLNKHKNVYRFAILTNKSEYFTKKILKHLQIDTFFSFVITGDHPKYKKPSPEGIYRILQEWNLKNNEIVIIGDHYTDIECAKTANIVSIFAMYGYGYIKEQKPNYYIKKFRNLEPLLRLI